MEQVILVNERNEETGLMEKMEAHAKGLLHRAFSVFIFNTKGELLLQQRTLHKYHSGGLWTNTCCSHPRPGEEILQAAHRRLYEEMGFDTALKNVFDFTYKTNFDNGLTEYEYDHVITGIYEGNITPDANEVLDYRYMNMRQLEASVKKEPHLYTSWLAAALSKVAEWCESKNVLSK